MTEPIDLLSVLSLTDVPARTRDFIFTGMSIPTPNGRAFGGQVLGQAIMAAGATVEDDRQIHSMHCYFLRPGRADQRMTLEVSNLHDARSFSTRSTQVYQDGEMLMSLFTSFQIDQAGADHFEPFDISSVPEPESLASQQELYGHLADDHRIAWLLKRPFDFRYTTSDILFSVEDQSPTQMIWMRASQALPSNPLLHRAALAFGSDYTLVETVLRAHGYPWSNHDVRFASLDHAMWFHRPFRADDWLLYVHETPTAQGGRGLTHGKFYDRAGTLVASVTQESMIRLPE